MVGRRSWTLGALVVAVVVGAAAPPVVAQPASAPAAGKLLPSADLPDGRVMVRVVAGDFTAPVAHVEVTLTGSGAPRIATTNPEGRVVFDDVAAGATVQVAIAPAVPGTADSFTMPGTGGMRVLLSTAPWESVTAAPPSPRKVSGEWNPDTADPVGSAAVRLTYDDLADPRPPAGVTVALVGYGADERVTVVRHKTDAKGIARFTGLNTSGAVAYYALAQLPRNGRADRLSAVSPPAASLALAGIRLILSAAARTATAAPIDDAQTLASGAPVAIARGHIRVEVAGAGTPDMPLTLVDAATGKVVARGVVPATELVLKVAARPGQVLYADLVARDKHYRSAPVMVVADRGAPLTVHVYPRVMATYALSGVADDDLLRMRGTVTLSNYAWSPYAENLPLTIPLPRGATHVAAFASDDDVTDLAQGDGFLVHRPLPSGGQTFRVAFELPAQGRTIPWSLPLPFGAYESSVMVEQEGVTLDAPPELAVTTVGEGVTNYLAVERVTLMPHTSLELTIHPPTWTRAEAALNHACRSLAPDRTPLRGQRAPGFVLAQLDGTPLKLAALRGKPVLVNFMATWDMLSGHERPQLAALAKQAGDLAIVLVASDRDPAEVGRAVGAGQPFRVVLDPPADDGSNLGRVTTTWGTRALPESFLVDRKGIVRAYFANARDWTTPAALACVKAVAAIR